MRLQFQALTGSFATIGENMDDFGPERMRLLTLVLPSYGQAARPLDLFIHNTPEVYDLTVKTGWDSWHVLLLQNWNEWDKSYDIRFSDMGLDVKKTYRSLVFGIRLFLGSFGKTRHSESAHERERLSAFARRVGRRGYWGRTCTSPRVGWSWKMCATMPLRGSYRGSPGAMQGRRGMWWFWFLPDTSCAQRRERTGRTGSPRERRWCIWN